MDKPMIWIAGPCVIESEQLVMEIAPRLAQIADRRPTTLRWYFTTCPDSSDQLKRAARLVFESLNLQRSA